MVDLGKIIKCEFGCVSGRFLYSLIWFIINWAMEDLGKMWSVPLDVKEFVTPNMVPFFFGYGVSKLKGS